MSDCIFCRIASGEIPAALVWQDEAVVACRDLQPAAPIHVLVIPRRHVASLAATLPDDAALLGRLMDAVRRVAAQEGLAATGYRTVLNTGADGGQSVGHLHAHVLGGVPMGWPPFPV
jgi:histidine triad (HIT) family protein